MHTSDVQSHVTQKARPKIKKSSTKSLDIVPWFKNQ